jgi:hypothetical protein
MTAAAQLGTPRRLRALIPVLIVWVAIPFPIVVPSYRCPTAALSHRPCPGCGMTRAMFLLFDGHLGASLAMHPLALPTSLAYAAIALTSVASAWRSGSAFAVFEDRWGRRALFFLVGVMTLNFLLWIARGCGALGGPVPV